MERSLSVSVRGPKTYEYEVYAISKAYYIILRVLYNARTIALFSYISVDLFPIELSYNSYRYVIIMICYTTKYVIIDTLIAKDQRILIF
jgi:hypothetical protein